MKKVFVALIFAFVSQICVYAQEFVFPPELNWWLDEIKKVDSSVSVDKFKFAGESFIYQDDHPVSYKNKLYPVLKKWNYFGDRFAYYSVGTELYKEKSGKYSLSGDPDSIFGVFDRKENLLFAQFFGAGVRINSFWWVTDSRIVATGDSVIIQPKASGDNLVTLEFTIYDYQIKDAKMTVREFTHRVENINRGELDDLKLNWWEQRSDYFETQKE